MNSTLIWCNLNSEQDALEKILGDKCVSIRGTTKPKDKIERERMWREGEVPILITKPLCFGYGMNWQHCHNMIFVGLSDSYEQYYQAVRRCWRFGQEEEVNVYIIISAKEGCVKENIDRKQELADIMQEEMLKHTKDITKKNIKRTCRITTPYNANIDMILPDWNEFK